MQYQSVTDDSNQHSMAQSQNPYRKVHLVLLCLLVCVVCCPQHVPKVLKSDLVAALLLGPQIPEVVAKVEDVLGADLASGCERMSTQVKEQNQRQWGMYLHAGLGTAAVRDRGTYICPGLSLGCDQPIFGRSRLVTLLADVTVRCRQLRLVVFGSRWRAVVAFAGQ